MPVNPARSVLLSSLFAARSGTTNFMRGKVRASCLVLSCLCTSIAPSLGAQELLARELLVQMSRNQSSLLCGLNSFTECMNFSEKECLALSEQAIKQCLMPLPEKINPSELENDSIEACPKKVYEDAGYSDDKAQACLQEASKK